MITILRIKDWLKKPAWIKPSKKQDKKLSEKAVRIMISTSHESIEEAVLSDLIDAIPIVGDFGNAMRVIDAAKKGESTALGLQSGDLIVGIIPIVGDIADLLTPTNTVVYVLKKKKLESEIANKLGKGYV